MRRAIRAALAVSVVGAVLIPPIASAGGGGCAHGTPATSAKGVAVRVEDNCFTPTVIWVAPGKTVTWTNRDNVQHTVTATGFVFNSEDMSLGDRFSVKFDRTGVYPFMCIYHPGMAGAVVVGTPVAPKTSTALSGPMDGTLETAPLVASPQAESAPIVPAATTSKSPDTAVTASLTAIAAAVMGAAGYAFGRRRRRQDTP